MIDIASEVQGECSVQARLANAEPQLSLVLASSCLRVQNYKDYLYLKNILSILLVKLC